MTSPSIVATRNPQTQRVAHVLLQLQIAAEEMSRLAREAMVLMNALSATGWQDAGPEEMDG